MGIKGWSRGRPIPKEASNTTVGGWGGVGAETQIAKMWTFKYCKEKQITHNCGS